MLSDKKEGTSFKAILL